MQLLVILLDFVLEVLRVILLEKIAERVRRARLVSRVTRLRGMNDVRRHIHSDTRRRLLNHLSTGGRQ